MGSCTLGGKPVLLDYGNDIEAMISSRLRSFTWPQIIPYTDDPPSSPTAPRTYGQEVFALPYGDPPDPRVNEWIHPGGISRYGRGMFLVDNDAMDWLAQTAFGFAGSPLSAPLPGDWGTGINPVELSIDYDNNFTVDVYLLNPMRVESNGVELWIVPAVDYRYKLLHLFEQNTITEGYDFTSAFTDLAVIASRLINHGAIDNRYGIVESRVFSEGPVSIAVAIDALSLGVGLRPIFVPNTEVIVCQDAADAIAELDFIFADSNLTLGGESPKQVRPTFFQVAGPTAKDYMNCGQEWSRLEAVTGGAPGAEYGVNVFTTFYQHSFTESETASNLNAAAQDALIEVMLEDYGAWNHKQAFLVAPGVRLWRLCSCLDYVSIYIKGSDSVYTSAITLPPDFWPRVNHSQWTAHYLHQPDGSGWWLKSTSAGIPSRPNPNEPGKGKATIQYLSVFGFNTLIDESDYSGFPLEEVPVYNISDASILGNDYFQADTVGCEIVASPTAEGGGSGNTITFEIIGQSGIAEAASAACEDQLEDAASSYEARVTRRPCGLTTVPGETEAGTVIVHDSLGSFLANREAAQVAGKVGVATYLIEDGGYECQWVITFIDWWREVQMVSDVIHTADEIRFKIKKVKVWDDCDLPDVVIPLTDCAEEAS